MSVRTRVRIAGHASNRHRCVWGREGIACTDQAADRTDQEANQDHGADYDALDPDQFMEEAEAVTEELDLGLRDCFLLTRVDVYVTSKLRIGEVIVLINNFIFSLSFNIMFLISIVVLYIYVGSW